MAKLGFSAAPHVVPGHPARFVCEGTTGAAFDFGGPGSFDIGGAFRRGLVKAGQQFRSNVRAFLKRQRQSFPQNVLRS